MHLAPSDEFYILNSPSPNHLNYHVWWVLSLTETETDEHYQELAEKAECISVFVCFTVKCRLLKSTGRHGIEGYFRETILRTHVLSFLKELDNILDPQEVFLHEKTPSFKAKTTQAML